MELHYITLAIQFSKSHSSITFVLGSMLFTWKVGVMCLVARGLSTVNRGTPSQHEIQMSLNCADIVISGHHVFYSATTILESVGNTITMLNIIKKRHWPVIDELRAKTKNCVFQTLGDKTPWELS